MPKCRVPEQGLHSECKGRGVHLRVDWELFRDARSLPGASFARVPRKPHA
jgi:hypothetical protein